MRTRQRLERLLDSPYFGRVDFQPDGQPGARDFYVGVHNFRDPESQEIVVHDWRAPVSSLYYDYETGEASYEAPEGTVAGEITGKRQYKIVGGRLEYMFDSAITIGDDVLRRELGHAGSPATRPSASRWRASWTGSTRPQQSGCGTRRPPSSSPA